MYKKIIAIVIPLCIIAAWLYMRTPKAHVSASQSATLIVGTNAEYPPMSFKKDGVIVGFDIDIAHELAKRLNKHIKLVDMPFDSLLPMLQIGDVHCVAAGMTSTPERAKRILFTKPYLADDPLVIISLAADPLTTLDQLNGKEVVVNDGYTADSFISSLQGPIVKRLATPAEAFLALKSKAAAAFVSAESSVRAFFAKDESAPFTKTVIPNSSDSYSIAVSPRFQELLPIIQQHLDAMEKDGTMNALKKKWGYLND